MRAYTRKYKKIKSRKNIKRNTKKRHVRKSKLKRYNKKRHMKGGSAELSKMFNINLGPAEANLKGLEGDVYTIEHSLESIPKPVGHNVGQPNNSFYTGFGWYE